MTQSSPWSSQIAVKKNSEEKVNPNILNSMCNRYTNPLGSAWRWQVKTVLRNINSSKDMKTQTSKCHTFSVLLFNQLSLSMQLSHKFFHSSINYVTFSTSLCVLSYAATHGTTFPISSPHKIVFSKRMTALQTSGILNINAK